MHDPIPGHSFASPRPSQLLTMAAFLVDNVIAELEAEEDPDNEGEYRQLMDAAQTIRAWAETHQEIEGSVN